MQIWLGTAVLVGALGLASCSTKPDQPAVVKVDKAFASAGSIEMQLEGGDYTIRAASDEHIHVSFSGNIGNAAAELAVNGTHANLTVKDTPHDNFHAIIDVPATSDIAVRLGGGNLEIAAITGNKDIDSKAGNVEIRVPEAKDYASVDASVMAGNLDGGPFGESGSGVAPHVKWSGPGKYRLHASLGAGNLELKH